MAIQLGPRRKRGDNSRKDSDFLDIAYEYGINFLDTADQYGDSPGTGEKYLGDWLADVDREQFIIVLKDGLEYRNQPNLRDFHANISAVKSIKRLIVLRPAILISAISTGLMIGRLLLKHYLHLTGFVKKVDPTPDRAVLTRDFSLKWRLL